MPTRAPARRSFAIVPPTASSTSSAWAPTASTVLPAYRSASFMRSGGEGELIGALAAEQVARLGAAIEKQIHCREPGVERPRAALRIHRMRELLQLERDAGARECRAVEISARAAEADDQRAGADGLADIEHQLALCAADAEPRALHERRADAIGVSHEGKHGVVQLDEPRPALRVNALEPPCVDAEVAGRAVSATQRLVMHRRPIA